MHFELKIFLEPSMFCHLAEVLIYLCGGVGKVKDPRYMQNKKDPRISLLWIGNGKTFLESLTIPSYFLWVKIWKGPSFWRSCINGKIWCLQYFLIPSKCEEIIVRHNNSPNVKETIAQNPALCTTNCVVNYPLLIYTWFLKKSSCKNQVRQTEFLACKNKFRN